MSEFQQRQLEQLQQRIAAATGPDATEVWVPTDAEVEAVRAILDKPGALEEVLNGPKQQPDFITIY